MATKYVKLPNEKIVALDSDGFIHVKVEIELSSVIDTDGEGLLDTLSELATGSTLLSDISYKIVGHSDDVLDMLVSGSVDGIRENDGLDEVSVDDLPEREFEVQVTRVGYGNRTIRLSARTEQAAIEIADDDAGNHLYSEHHSDYLFEVTPF